MAVEVLFLTKALHGGDVEGRPFDLGNQAEACHALEYPFEHPRFRQVQTISPRNH